MIDLIVNGEKIKNIDTILFDKDGTIIDSNIYWGEIIKRRSNKIIEYYGMSKSEFEGLCNVMGLDLKRGVLFEKGPIAIFGREKIISIVINYLSSKNIISNYNEISELFIKVHNEFKLIMLEYIHLIPGVKEFLVDLKRNDIKIAIVTSDTKDNTDIIINYLKINHLVDAVIGKDCTVEDKSTGIPAIKALSMLSSCNENAVCIGDTEVDILMAKNSKCSACISVATGQITLKSLKNLSKFTVSNMKEISILKEK